MDLQELKQKSPGDLLAFAEELEIEGASNLRTQDMMFGILKALAEKGPKQAMLDDPHLLRGLNVHRGMVTYEDVARDLGYDYVPALKAMETW